MQRYFIQEKCMDGDYITVTKEDYKHMFKVMRFRNDDQVICILSDSKVYQYHIEDADKGLLKRDFEIIENNELDVEVTLVYSLVKSDKFDYVLQKATELGVNTIVPFLAKRSVVKLNKDSFQKKEIRYQRILKEASEQSCRQRVPQLMPLCIGTEISQYLSDVNLVAYEEASKQGEQSRFAKALNSDYHSITIVVGPEGGFEQSEIDMMASFGIKECSLGKRILRSETAPLYMLSVIGYSRELKL